MKYFSRLGIYKASNVTFNPNTMSGYSYKWYELTKSIKGVVVLNCYNYSSTTIKHIRKTRRLLNKLGIKHVELMAPKGLQNLDLSLEHCLYEYGNAVVEFNHARKPIIYRIEMYKKMLDLLVGFGYKVTIKMKNDNIYDAEIRRTEKLASKREANRIKRLKTKALTEMIQPIEIGA